MVGDDILQNEMNLFDLYEVRKPRLIVIIVSWKIVQVRS